VEHMAINKIVTLVELLGQRSQKKPAQLLYSFIDNNTETTLTLGELDAQARLIASRIIEYAVPGDRAILLYQPGLEFISALLGCFYAKIIAVPIYSHNLQMQKLGLRLMSVINDTESKLILTTNAILTEKKSFTDFASQLENIAFIATDTMSKAHENKWIQTEINPESIAFLQYSSGSTGSPKGVMVTHQNLMSNLKIIQDSFGLIPKQSVVSWLPHYHDMGLIGNVLGAMFSQTPLYLFSPTDFIRRPLRWLQLISNTRSTVSGGPNFAYELCCQRMTKEQCEGLDLSSWEVAYNGAEMVRESTLTRFKNIFAPYGFKAKSFHPCYGLAEATLMVTSSDKSQNHRELSLDKKTFLNGEAKKAYSSDAASTLVSSGHVHESQQIEIVDPETKKRCASGKIGEIWVKGPSVCKGYWNKPDATDYTFSAKLEDEKDSFLRTGDMGFLEDNWLYVTGRIKDLIIIRGQNHSPQDIEATAIESHPLLSQSHVAAFSLERDGQENLVLLVTQPKSFDDYKSEIAEAIQSQVTAKHELVIKELAFIKRSSLPLTSSGKIQRGECKRRFTEGLLNVIHQVSVSSGKQEILQDAIVKPDRKELCKLSSDSRFAIVLNYIQKILSRELDLPLHEINIIAPLNVIALDSLSKVTIHHDIQEATGIQIDPERLVSNFTLIQLAREISDEMINNVMPETFVSDYGQNEYPLSHGQRSLFFLNKLISGSLAYNISRAVKVTSPLVISALKQAFETLIKRHVALRTRLFEKNDVLVQTEVDSDQITPAFEVINASKWSQSEIDEHLEKAANHPFDLNSGVMIRLLVFQREHDHVLLFCVHHIISDLSSLTVLVTELCEYYSAVVNGQTPLLLTLNVHPIDHVRYEERFLNSDRANHMRQYWLQDLTGHVEPLDLPADRPRPAVKSYHGSTILFQMPKSLTQPIQAFASSKGVTPYVVFISAYIILLHRYTGKSNIIVGSPMANRMGVQFAKLVSYLVNPVAIRANFVSKMTLEDVIEQVKVKTLSAFANQEYPFSKVIEDFKIKRDPSTTPLFQAMFCYLNPLIGNDMAAFAMGQPGSEFKHKELILEPYALENGGAQFDLNVSVAVINDSIASTWEFSTDLFNKETIRRMEQHFQIILNQIVSDPKQLVNEFTLLSNEEIYKVTVEWNNTESDHDLKQPLHHLFERQVEKTPNLVAVLDKNKSLSYKNFNKLANQLAHHLRRLGVGPETVVAIYMERSIEMVVALYAVLKAGGAYLPIDPHYPKKHTDWVIEDSHPTVILTQAAQSSSLDYVHCPIVIVQPNGEGFDDMPSDNPRVEIDPENMAYIIYTSGSTGKPKGVIIPHCGICNRILWMQEEYKLSSEDRVLQKTPYTFDVSVWEFFWPMMVGASLYISDPDGHKDPYYLADIISQSKITTIHFVPSMLRPFLENKSISECKTLERVFCSGESLNPDLAKLCLDLLSANLYNLYGPTETSVDVSSWQCLRNKPLQRVLIGRPIANIQLYILDSLMQPVPIGVHGELYIGGIGLARGYLNRPELTSERFVTNPFSLIPHSRLYKTGDLSRYLSDGTVEYLGRIDNQVKIRGFRIELEEIESAICTHLQISEAIAIAIRDESGSSRLALYFVPSSFDIPAACDLRAYLSERLPEHMLPSLYISLDHIPLLANGKIDRKSLPKPDVTSRADTNRVYIAPISSTERMLCSIYEEILGVRQVGIHDNFFDLGGDSLLVLRAVARIREMGLDVAIHQLYTNASVANVASVIEKNNLIDTQSSNLQPFCLVSLDDRELLPNDIEEAYPLSKMQEGLVFHSEFSPDYETYVMGLHIGLSFNQDALNKALTILSRRHPLLRTSFDLLHYSAPLQIVHTDVTIPVNIIDIQRLSAEAQENEIERYMREEKWRKFDWSKAPFLRMIIHKRSLTSNQFTFCHPLFDGWSMGLLITEFFTIYGALLKNKQPPLGLPPSLTYRDFVVLEQNTIGSEASLQYWREKLAGAMHSSDLPRWPANRKSGPGMHVRVTVKVASTTLAGLRQLATLAEVPFKSVLLAAHMRVVGLLTGRKDVSTGLLVNGRPEKLDADRMIGMFLNTVPFSVNLHCKDWIELVKETFNSERNMLPHRRFPLAELTRIFGNGGQLFETAFNYIHFHIYNNLEKVPDLSVLGWKSPSDQTYFPLTAYFHLDISQASSELLFFLDVDSGVLDQRQIDALQHYYLNTLDAMASDYNAEYKNISLLPAKESQLLISEWNNTKDITAQTHPFIHQRFSIQAKQNANKIAVTFNDEHITYDELEKRSNRLAHYLRDLGVGPNVLVGIFLERSLDLIIALLAVLKAGGAYVPLDPLYPQDRLDFMLKDSRTPVVITTAVLNKKLPQGKFQTVSLDRHGSVINERPNDSPDFEHGSEDLAYVIYTSGSTGKPKGVEIPHKALGNFISSIQTLLNWTSSDVLLAVTTISFDIAGLELYLPLSTGAHMVLASREMSLNGEKLAETLAVLDITTMQATPATWRMLINTGWTGLRGLRALCGGERMSIDLAKELLDRGCSLWNLYGPTETTIWSTIWQVESAGELIPIGRPIGNTSTYILDEFKQLVPVGVAGELYIGGHGVARGYRNLPEQTAEKFCIDPFSLEANARMYRTGDLARFRPDGVLEYISRIDQQVKVRGFRIELGEIETVLNHIAGIDKAITKILEDDFGESYIVAYLLSQADHCFTNTALRNMLLDKLPAYMVPSNFVFLKEFPLTPNGKIDYKTLPKPEELRPQLNAAHVAPRNYQEEKIAEIYAEILGVDRIGIDDNFFDMGGHSLSLVRMHVRLQDLLKRKLPIVQLFEYPTIRKIAALFDKQDTQLKPVRPSHRANTRRDWVSKWQDRRKITDNVSEKA
jgi:amino acid adenylation domain-containing protein